MKVITTLLFLVVTGTACFTGKPLGYFEVDPYARQIDRFTDATITLVADPGILEAHLIDKQPNKYRHFTHFRTTLLRNWEKLLQPHFRAVHVADAPAPEGYSLLIHRMDARVEQPVEGSGLHEDHLFTAVFDYDLELLYDGRTLDNARGRARGIRRFGDVMFWDTAMISAFEYALEEAFAKLFVDEAVSEQ